MHTQLYAYLCDNHLLSNKRFGFRLKASTVTATAQFTDQILTARDNEIITGAVFIDLIYINDLPDRLDFPDITLYADDTVLFIYSKSIYSIDSKLNSDLDKVSKWFISHQLTLNINKTKFIIIGSSQRLKKLKLISITTD